MRGRTKILPSLAALGLLVSGGCATVGPKYRPPEFEIPVQWNARPNADTAQVTVDEEALAEWWVDFQRPDVDPFD